MMLSCKTGENVASGDRPEGAEAPTRNLPVTVTDENQERRSDARRIDYLENDRFMRYKYLDSDLSFSTPIPSLAPNENNRPERTDCMVGEKKEYHQQELHSVDEQKSEEFLLSISGIPRGEYAEDQKAFATNMTCTPIDGSNQSVNGEFASTHSSTSEEATVISKNETAEKKMNQAQEGVWFSQTKSSPQKQQSWKTEDFSMKNAPMQCTEEEPHSFSLQDLGLGGNCKRKLRILALHGEKGNNQVTQRQLENLRITQNHYDIVYFHGSVIEDEAEKIEQIENDILGPFYSWFHDDHTESRFRTNLLAAAGSVMKAIEAMGPFDAIYGFSQGAVVATIVASASTDTVLREAIIEETSKAENPNGSILSIEAFSLGHLILACAACDNPTFIHDRSEISIDIPSIHLIGIEDPSRSVSEDVTDLFSDVQVEYMNTGHCVDESISRNQSLLHSIHSNLLVRKNLCSENPPRTFKVSQVSTISVMQDIQGVTVKLHGIMDDPTIMNVLESKEPHSPMLYNAREIDSSKCTTYGDVLNFMRGGPGDLRRLGVKHGEVVAYCAPAGAIAALAFLSIAAQTLAAPLGHSDSESNYTHLLEMFDARHVIIFDSAECPGLESALTIISKKRKIKVHRGVAIRDEKPGWFQYTQSDQKMLDRASVLSGLPLHNPSDGVALLLSTSGTTSRPKGVPLLHKSILQNAQIIATSLGLLATDVCYNIMPLFHIGGISTSILSTIISGGAMCCDDETYDPENMIDALALSDPQPTWYSAVPTIHNSTVSFIKNNVDSMKLDFYGVGKDGVWKEGHALRFVRSGAAALLKPDAKALASVYGNIPVYPTYSMSEQMPITQPPNGKDDMVYDKEGSVGVPVSASLVIVDSTDLKILPYGQVGEVAISGSTVMKNYLSNPEADRKAFFKLVFPNNHSELTSHRFFLTGDTGMIDKDGFLSLKGRNKELILKGGEQISPFEIEEILLSHFWIEVALCFSVPSELYGEEVGCALVLSPSAPVFLDENDVSSKMRELLWASEVCPSKWPTKWKIVREEQLPQTKSKKYIRIDLSTKLDMDGRDKNKGTSTCDNEDAKENNAHIDWDAINGLRFVLACYVMFMHVGSNESWGAFNLLRGFPWHVHCFFTLGGFSMAAPMSSLIEEKFKYFLARIGNMYPMYVVAVIFTLINLLISCRPSTFRPGFHWDAQPDDLYIGGKEENGLAPLFCEGTPITPNSYWASLFLTIIVYVLGLTITPVWVAHWWMGYYSWFASMYYQCLVIFPHLYNQFLNWRGKASQFLWIAIFLMVLNYIILFSTWCGVKDARGYEHYDPTSGEKNSVDDYNEDAFWQNSVVLGWFLFSPFWMIYFIIGITAAFLYDAYRPLDRSKSHIWGVIADGCTIAILSWSIVIVSLGNTSSLIELEDTWDLRPSEANHPHLDNAATNRIWDSIHGRMVTPLTTLWIFSLSTGKGFTASVLRVKFLAQRISPHAYNCFLFHQMISQWYFAATRNGQWWNWWQYRKTMYWFSPHPVPVQWYEYFPVVLLTVAFSALMQVTLEPIASSTMIYCKRAACSALFSDYDKTNLDESVHHAIEDITGLSPEREWTLGQSGLSSVGLPQLASRLGNAVSSKELPVSVSARELSRAETVGDIVKVLEESIHKKQYDLIANSSIHGKSFGDQLRRSFNMAKDDLDPDDDGDSQSSKRRRTFSDILSLKRHRQKYDLDDDLDSSNRRHSFGDMLSRSHHRRKYDLDGSNHIQNKNLGSKNSPKLYESEDIEEGC